MRYRCSSCGQVTESPVELSEPQLAVQACIACGSIGTTTYWPEADVRWWIGIRGERHGPYVLAQLQAMAAAGRLSPNSYVWGPNFASWARAGTLAEFAGRFAVAPPPVTPTPPVAEIETRSAARSEAEVSGASEAASAVEPEVAVKAVAPEARPPTSLDLPVAEAEATVTGGGEVTEAATAAELGPLAPDGVDGADATASADAPSVRLDLSRLSKAAASSPAAEVSDEVAVARPVAPPPLPAAPKAVAPPPLPVRKVALDDARRPPPTRFGLPVVVPVAPEAAVSALEVGASPPAIPALPATGPVGRPAAPVIHGASRGLTRLGGDGSAADALLVDRALAAGSGSSSVGTLLEPMPTRESLAVPAAVGGPVADVEEDFFAGEPAEREAPDAGLFAQAAPMRVGAPSRHEMQALRQEFSVVARLERHKRRRVLTTVLVTAGIAAVVVLAALFSPAREYFTSGRGTGATEDEAFRRETYAVPQKTVEGDGAPEVASAETGAAPASGATRSGGGRRKTRDYAIEGVQPRAAEGGVDGPAAVASRTAAGLESRETQAAKLRQLAAEEDEFGKSEIALGFDSGEAARKAEAAAAERKSIVSAEQAEKVAAAFAGKLAQFKRCSTDNPEKVKAIFTVTIHGKVVNPQVVGTSDVQKRECVLGILRQAVFPAGDSAQTFSQTVTL
jgi:hypothetical protein